MKKEVLIAHVLIRPIVTEKSVAAPGKYTFEVHQHANKDDVKKAVKEFYKLDTEKVNVRNQKAKTASAGRRQRTRRPAKRFATVTLKSGQTINFNDFK